MTKTVVLVTVSLLSLPGAAGVLGTEDQAPIVGTWLLESSTTKNGLARANPLCQTGFCIVL
jgi:hypothetical protein